MLAGLWWAAFGARRSDSCCLLEEQVGECILHCIQGTLPVMGPPREVSSHFGWNHTKQCVGEAGLTGYHVTAMEAILSLGNPSLRVF